MNPQKIGEIITFVVSIKDNILDLRTNVVQYINDASKTKQL
jgi:hypothetical protein